MANTKLEDKYSWEELGEIVYNRICESKFLTKINKNDFLKWFDEREKVGWRFDWRLVARAYAISQQLNNQGDHFTVIVGGEGSGKSTLGEQFCSWIAPDMEIKDVVFDIGVYIRRLRDIAKEYKKVKKNRSLQIDEGGISLFSREALSTSNRVLAKTFMAQRFLNVHVSICIPHYWSLDPLIRNHRINTLIIIKKRGKYKVISGKGIKIFNKVGTKDKTRSLLTIAVPYGYFFEGDFRKDFTDNISNEEYEDHKFNHIKGFLDDAQTEASTLKMIKLNKVENELGLARQTLINYINNGTIEGKKIGSQWFITQKAYEKLLNIGDK